MTQRLQKLKPTAVEQEDHIPSLPSLALQYGTITKEQFSHIHHLVSLNERQDRPVDFSHLLLTHKFATAYQIGLLTLIQEYLIIKKRGEEFGAIAVEKGFATREDVDRALELQKKEFQQAKVKKLIGDILVESRVLTEKQKNIVLREQTFLDTQAEKIFAPEPSGKIDKNKDLRLSDYEQQFLRIKVLDKEFAASILEKGFVSVREVRIAQKIQEQAFERENHIQFLGSIMVELNYLTEEQNNLILDEQNRLKVKHKPHTHPGIRVSISPDRMEATLFIKDHSPKITIKEIKQALETTGVKYGIYPDALLQCNLDMKNTEFPVARQDFSLELIKSRRAVYHFDTGPGGAEVKKKGETLAEQNFGGDTHLKKDLFGKDIQQTRGYDLTFRCASGTRLSNDRTKAFAGKTGVPALSIEKKIYVHPFINVLEDADLKYGPLEKYAHLNISGVLTGAYPVTAGKITVREIRNAHIDAVGEVNSHIGITNSTIYAQGDIHARYIHNCRIETFGNIYVENEIIDSQIFCSGKIDSSQCRVISSALYAKQGIDIAGAGSIRTTACSLAAGTEHHILERARRIHLEIKNISQQLDALKQKWNEQDHYAKKTFQKMIELKIFHDRARNKKQKLGDEFKKKKNKLTREKSKNILTLVKNFEKRMAYSISSLKKLNTTKKKYENERALLEKKINRLEPKIQKEITELKIDLFMFFEWTRKQQNLAQIKINKNVFPGTVFKGVYSSLEVKKNLGNFTAFEQSDSKNGLQIKVRKN